MAKLIIDLSKLRDSELDNKAQTVIDNTAANAIVFSNPIPALTDVESILGEYRTSLAAAAGKDTHAVEVKKEKRRELEQVLRKLALYIEQQANGNRAILLSSGFDVWKTREPNGICPKPGRFKVENPAPGRVKMSVKPNKMARMYQFEYRLAGDTAWMVHDSSRSSVILEGFEAAKLYEFRAVLRGTNPARTYSDVITMYIV